MRKTIDQLLAEEAAAREATRKARLTLDELIAAEEKAIRARATAQAEAENNPPRDAIKDAGH